MRPLRSAATLAVMLLPASLVGQDPATHGNPDSAQLVTSDIPRFWRAFDSVPLDSGSLNRAGPVFQRVYIDSGSTGLQDFIPDRIVSGDHLAETVGTRWRYYAAIRGNTLAVDTAVSVKRAIHASFRHLKSLCADAVFPDVYFVIGAGNSGGTASPHGLMIGVEMNARDDATPVDQLSAWQRANIGHIVDLPAIVSHELIHFQQPASTETPTLLTTALREGGADFVAELISSMPLNGPAHAYGEAHEASLWHAFRQSLDSTQLQGWFYQGDKAGDRPADLGYYEGYKIAEAFYRHATDKPAAICAIMHETNAHDFLRQSGYNGHSPLDEAQ